MQKGVTRLSRAIDVADDEMDTALRRTEEVHRIAGRRRDQEIAELRRVIAAKERGIDSLRETLSGTKRTLEGRMRQLEDAIMQRDDEVLGLCTRIWSLSAEGGQRLSLGACPHKSMRGLLR